MMACKGKSRFRLACGVSVGPIGAVGRVYAAEKRFAVTVAFLVGRVGPIGPVGAVCGVETMLGGDQLSDRSSPCRAMAINTAGTSKAQRGPSLQLGKVHLGDIKVNDDTGDIDECGDEGAGGVTGVDAGPFEEDG